MNLLSKLWSDNSYRSGIFSIVATIAVYFMLPADMPEAAKRMTIVFVLAAFFWALEVLPLFATSVVVVVMEILLLAKPGGVLGMDKGGYKQFLVPFGSPIIFLFFGGFIIAKAMHKYHLDRLIARKLLKVFGTRPYFIMVGFMVTTAFLSMWMSNTATTAMMMVMVMPLLSQMDETDKFRRGLVLAIPFAANIGGIGTPVGTPPNAIALGILATNNIHVSFLSWMKMAVPLEILLLALTSFLLYFLYPSKKKTLHLELKEERKVDNKALLTGGIALVTVVLWLTSQFHGLPSAVVALIAAMTFLATGLLDRKDLNSLDWDVLVLMWGGLALGKGMAVSGLTKYIVALPLFDQNGLILVAIFCVVGVVLSTFMSNTATANLLIPIVISIPGENHVILATTVALSCSFAMALPISTPPNAIAFASNMIKSKHMLVAGAIVSIVSVLMVLIGYQIIIPAAMGIK